MAVQVGERRVQLVALFAAASRKIFNLSLICSTFDFI